VRSSIHYTQRSKMIVPTLDFSVATFLGFETNSKL
jgi:hypothetical protein